jgi:hypothetical protein
VNVIVRSDGTKGGKNEGLEESMKGREKEVRKKGGDGAGTGSMVSRQETVKGRRRSHVKYRVESEIFI